MFDVAIVGGGAVGIATAYKILRRRPAASLVILEKENALAAHQTGHNSGVIHSGIYYRPGSLKATNCRRGVEELIQFCDEHGVGYELCGKLIVATDSAELPALEALYDRGVTNGVAGLKRLGAEELEEIEPEARGAGAILSPNTGIIDYSEVVRAAAEDIRSRGGAIVLGARLIACRESGAGVSLETTAGAFEARSAIAAAGLHSDRVAALTGLTVQDLRVFPFRGEYYRLKPGSRRLVRHMIYPVPDPRFPFLGVHFTRTVHGDVEAGPNAVLAFAREGYRHRDVNLRDLWEMLSYPGFWRLGRMHAGTALNEMYRSLSRRAFVRSLQKLIPAIADADVERAGAGVRAMALATDGVMLDDFAIQRSGPWIHVLNAPSPAATSCLSIGETIAEAAGF